SETCVRSAKTHRSRNSGAVCRNRLNVPRICMLTVAYLANQFPSAVEPYVEEEIKELCSRGVAVITGSVRKPALKVHTLHTSSTPDVVVTQQLNLFLVLRAAFLCLLRWNRISDLIWRVIFSGGESPWQRLKALTHTWLGACYALKLRKHAVEHIHVHHG